MKFVVITIFPELFDSFLMFGVIGRAFQSKKIHCHLVDLRSYSEDRNGRVDDVPFGGEDGMVMSPKPLYACFEDCLERFGRGKVVYLSPTGVPFNQSVARSQSQSEDVVYLLCGRYAGIDQRVIDSFVDELWSLGDFVLSGGETAAMAVIDAISRHVPGVLGNVVSVKKDSFTEGLLEHPLYTRPREYRGKRVPDVLLEGDHKKIAQWRLDQSLQRTRKLRPDLLTADCNKEF